MYFHYFRRVAAAPSFVFTKITPSSAFLSALFRLLRIPKKQKTKNAADSLAIRGKNPKVAPSAGRGCDLPVTVLKVEKLGEGRGRAGTIEACFFFVSANPLWHSFVQ